MKSNIEKIALRVQKPTRYVGGEFGSVIKTKEIPLRFAFCFPDTYEVGMSHLGMKIIYELLNSYDNIWCERCFAPWIDMQSELEGENIELFALESGDSLKEFDMLGFTLQYELSYTNVLNMLKLSNIPLRSRDRDESFPLVIAGGPCCVNPEPVADFFDIIVIGEGEEVLCEVCELYIQNKSLSKHEFLQKAMNIEGVYVPAFYEILYNTDGTIKDRISTIGAPKVIKKRIIRDIDKAFFPKKLVVPFGEIVHDRIMLELFRGCIRGCRFCQAGFIYRPVREKSADTLNNQAIMLCENTGYEEMSLSSLSSSDYTHLEKLLTELTNWTVDKKLNLSLPSLRVDNFPEELMKKVQKLKKSGLTFAPEAGTQRLRDVINKNVTEEQLITTCKTVFGGGNTSVKLYFMIGLPTETDEDIEGIISLAQVIVGSFYHTDNRQKGKGVMVTVSASCFVPKPFTPFQWHPQDSAEVFAKKQQILKQKNNSKKIKLSYHDSKTSILEAVFARGDRRLCDVLEKAFEKGCMLDGWSEHFKRSSWQEAFEECGVDPAFYASRERSYSEILPWDFIDIGVTKEFLISENEKAIKATTTANCREKCSGCGLKGAEKVCTI